MKLHSSICFFTKQVSISRENYFSFENSQFSFLIIYTLCPKKVPQNNLTLSRQRLNCILFFKKKIKNIREEVWNFFWCSLRLIQWTHYLSHSIKNENRWNSTLRQNRSYKPIDNINVILQLQKLQTERQYGGF